MNEVRYNCIVEEYELDIDNQEILISCSKLGGVILLSFDIKERKLQIIVNPQSCVNLEQNCKVIDKDWQQIESMRGPTESEGTI